MRLNQAGRQKIGYTYSPQVINDVITQPHMRNMAMVQEQDFIGQGMKKNSNPLIQADKIVFNALPYERQEVDKTASKLGNGLSVAGSGLSVAGGSRGSIQPSVGSGLSVAGGSRGSIQPSVGGGLSVAGGAIDIRGNQKEETLPGDTLRKKLLKKMLRERKMKALGDRVKTAPIKQGMDGGSLVIPTINNKMGSQSRSKTLPNTKSYKLNPKPLVGAGKNPKGGFIISGLIALGSAIAAAASAAAATTVVGSVTVGSLAGAALTGAATAAGSSVMKKALGKKGSGIKDAIVKVAKETKITFGDLSQEDKDKLKTEFEKLKKDKSRDNVIAFAKAIAPIALKATKKKLEPKVKGVFEKAGLKGSGLGLAGKGEKDFKNAFVKNLLKQMGV